MPTEHNAHKQIGQSVGAKLRAARQAKRYTQSQVAAPDFSISYISAIERGHIHPSLRALEIIAQRLGLSSKDLLPGHPQDETSYSLNIPPRIDDDTMAELTMIEAQTHILRGAPAKAIAHLKKLPFKKMHVHHLMHYRYLLGWAALLTEELEDCQKALLEVERLAIAHKDQYKRLHASNLLGLAYATMGDHQQALQTHQRCLELLQAMQPPDLFLLCQLYTHLGQHHTHLNNFESALTMFNQAIALADSLSSPEDLQATYWTMTQYYSRLKDVHRASLYAHKYTYLSQQPTNTSLKSEIYYYLGRALLQSNHETTRTLLEEMLSQPSNSQDTLSQASIIIHLAAWHLQQQELAVAEQLIAQAHCLAQPFGQTLIAAETLLLWGRIDFAQQRCEQGDQHFVAGLELLEQLGRQEELSDHAALYAQILDEHKRSREAISYYKRAFESRRRIGSYT